MPIINLEVKKILNEKQETKFMSLIYERCFDYIVNQNREILAAIISFITKMYYDYVFNNIRKISNNGDIRHKKDKKRQMDFVYEIGTTTIGIELNKSAKETLK